MVNGMGWRNDQCKKVCWMIEDFLANRPTERDSLIAAVQKAFDALEAHEGQRWIPVTEQLPEVGQRVLVTNKDGFIDIRRCIDAGHLAWFYSGIIAWMPYNLPEPYQERGGE